MAQLAETAPDIAAGHGFTKIAFQDDFTDGTLDVRWKTPRMRENQGRIRPYVRSEAVTFQSNFENHPSDNRLVLRTYNDYKKRSDGTFKQENGKRIIDRWIVGRIDTRTRYADTLPNGNPANDRLIHRGFEHRYGYIEARINFQTQIGGVGAFWLNSRRNHSENWRGPSPPQEPDGATTEQERNNFDRDFNVNFGNEIDIVEALRRHRSVNGTKMLDCATPDKDDYIDSSRCMIMNLHWAGGPRSENHRSTGMHVPVPPTSTPILDNWHTYGLLWKRDRYEFYLDGQKMWETNDTRLVSQRTEYIHLSMDVNGSSFVGGTPLEQFPEGYGEREDTPAVMEVKWIRWWSDSVPDPNLIPPRF